MGVWRCSHSEGNDEEILAPESRNQRFLVIVVDLDALDTLWRSAALALGTSQGSDSVLAGLEKL
jgi:hypothetical protein